MEGFALTISNPLYTILESAQIISALIFFARLIVNAVLPEAVGPVITISGAFFLFRVI